MTPEWAMDALRQISAAPQDKGIALVDLPAEVYQTLVSYGLIDRLLHPSDWGVGVHHSQLGNDPRRWGYRLRPAGQAVLDGAPLDLPAKPTTNPIISTKGLRPCMVCGALHARPYHTCSKACASAARQARIDRYGERKKVARRQARAQRQEA